MPDADYLIAQKRRADNVVRLASLRDKLLAARARRVRPGLDDKVLADWNGLMIAALVNAGTMLRRAVMDRRWRSSPSPSSPST